MTLSPEWLLTPERAAVHRPTGTAVIADLHLGYAQTRRSSGEAVPTWDIERVLSPLRSLFARAGVRRLVIAGDLLEDGRGGAAVLGQLTAWLAAAGCELAGVVPGNHDRGLEEVSLPVFREGVRLGGWLVVHGDGGLPEGPSVQGHVHPCLRWPPGVAAPCFLVRPRHLVLPAFSADAAGVNVLHDPRWRGYGCHVIAGDRVLDFGEAGTLDRRRRAHRKRQ